MFPYHAAPDEVQVLAAMRRHFWFLCMLVAGLVTGAYYSLGNAPDYYRAHATLLLAEEAEPATEAAILRSRGLMEHMLAALKKEAAPAIAPTRITRVLEGLKVLPQEDAKVVALEYVSTDPRYAAAVLNQLLKAYVAEKEKKQTAHRGKAGRQVEEMRHKLQELEKKQLELRRNSGGVLQEHRNLREEFLASLLRDQLQALRRLRETEQMLRAKAKEEDAHKNAALKEEKLRAQITLRTISKLIAETDRRLKDDFAAELSARLLKSEVDATRNALSSALFRANPRPAEESRPEILSKAYPPARPFKPKRTPIMIATFILAFIAAAGICVLRELAVEGFRTAGQLERETGLRVIASIPETAHGGREVNHLHLLDTARAPLYAEAIRTVRAAVFEEAEPAPQILLLCSAQPDEGKSATALSLATLMSQAGKKVLLLDADMRRSRLESLLGIGKTEGLAEYLSGTASFTEILRRDKETGLHFIAAGKMRAHPLDLLERPALRTLLAECKITYDFILIDAPPILKVRDARCFIPMADSALFLARWEKTPRRVVLEGLRAFGSSFAGKPLNLALSRVDFRRQRYYTRPEDTYLQFTNYAFHAKTPAAAATQVAMPPMASPLQPDA